MPSKPKITATKEEAKPALVPKLRFPEFRDDAGWEERQLSDITTAIFDGTHQTPTYTDEGVPFYSVENLVSGNANKFISRADYELATKKNKPEQGDVLITRIGKIGYSQVVTWSHDFSIYVTLAVIKRDQRFNSHYLNQFIQSALYQKEILSKSLLNAVPCKINMDSLRATRVLLASPAEQQKLAECLSSVDEVIAAQARKLDALKTHKKGLMQQLFPREGETQPRLRFPEFQNAGEWAQKTVGDVAEVLMCKRIFAEETNPTEGVPFYKIGTLGGVPDAFISREKFEDYRARYNYPRKGEVLITCSGTVGKCLPFDGKEAYFQDSNIVWLDNPKGKVSNEFLLMLLTNVNWGMLNSTTITRIYGPDLRGLAIKHPENKDEQHRIATCLSSLDALIAAETQKHAALHRHKRGLMQQLFPSPEEVEA